MESLQRVCEESMKSLCGEYVCGECVWRLCLQSVRAECVVAVEISDSAVVHFQEG